MGRGLRAPPFHFWPLDAVLSRWSPDVRSLATAARNRGAHGEVKVGETPTGTFPCETLKIREPGPALRPNPL